MEDKVNFNIIVGINGEQRLTKIYRVIEIAFRHNGRVFGGFLRDVMVPRLSDTTCRVSFKDVDLWFTSEQDAERFINEMNDEFIHKSEYDLELENETKYPFKKKQYHYIFQGKCVAWFDVIVSESFPVNDLNVNMLSFGRSDNINYIYYAFGNKYSFKSHSNETISELIQFIENKEAVILEPYQKILMSKQYSSGQRAYCRRLEGRFLERGWKIKKRVVEYIDIMNLNEYKNLFSNL